MRRAELLEQGLVAALEMVATMAVVCTRDGTVVYATPATRARLQSDEQLRARLLAALRGDERAHASSISLLAPGLPEHVLVSFDAVTGGVTFAERVNAAREAWRLTPRHADVLAHLVHGESNKQIAERLRLKENTVEVHVMALLRTAGLHNRAALAARFWSPRAP